jgi:hypothetical protein
MARRWILALAVLGVLTVAGCDSHDPTPIPVTPTLVEIPSGLARPYDFAGVRDALRSREVLLSVPTAAEVAGASISPAAAVTRIPAEVAKSYPGEGARIVSIHLAVVDITSARINVSHRLTYVVETDGHATGNCFTLYDGDTAEQYVAACFFAGR